MRALLVVAMLLPGVAFGADLNVLTAGAYRAVLVDLAPAVEAATGVHLVIANDTTGGIVRRLRAGETPDLVVMPPEAAAGLGAVLGPVTPLAKVGIGVAVAAGGVRPDISSEAAIRTLALGSRAPTWIDPKAGGSSGIYMQSLWDRWGIGAEMAGKAVLAQGGLAAEKIVAGQADLAFQQISELLAVPGVVVLGPLPASIQSFTVYAGAIPAAAGRGAEAGRVLNALAGPGAEAVLRAHGMAAP